MHINFTYRLEEHACRNVLIIEPIDSGIPLDMKAICIQLKDEGFEIETLLIIWRQYSLFNQWDYKNSALVAIGSHNWKSAVQCVIVKQLTNKY